MSGDPITKPITKIETHVRFDFTITAGKHLTSYLRGLARKQILGARCDSCAKVYVPSRGSCPTCGVPTSGEVELSDRGTVTTFCIINIPFGRMPFDPPYAAAAILLDGSDIPIFHLVRGIPVDEVRMGMRVKAAWVANDQLAPTLQSIQWFEPTGESDAPFESYADHL